MSNYPDDFTGTPFDAPQTPEQNIASDDLSRMLAVRQELAALRNDVNRLQAAGFFRHVTPRAIHETFGLMQESLDELLAPDWFRLSEIARDPTMPDQMPDLFPALATFRPQPTRGCAPTNPATLLAKGEAV